MVDIIEIEKIAREKFNNAKDNIRKVKGLYEFANKAISDGIPGYKADLLKFESFDSDNYSVLFIDIRQSTNRAKTIGPEKTYMSMHAFMPAMLEVIKYYRGYVIDLMGDGVMVFFGGKKSGISKIQATQNAGLCGIDMLNVLKLVVNKILNEEKIWQITCGIGIDYGNVIVTKIGIDGIFDVKAYGDCINTASKYCDEAVSQVLVSDKIEEMWPIGKHGKMTFKKHKSGANILIEDK
ncbi:adenylate/guanylate cyclase domain-containing protein [Clostridium sp. Mt-5]|uniref:Adenylate/guanylate cyclase domain-containing protein n=1 Tax=Clostridium moutaii TaxID=3240932 RepID=A0ABV4BRJ6_9CLOT